MIPNARHLFKLINFLVLSACKIPAQLHYHVHMIRDN